MYPQRQDIIILINCRYQFIYILIFFHFNAVIVDKAFLRQFVYFVYDTINVGMNTVYNSNARFLHYILPFISRYMLFVDITFFL